MANCRFARMYGLVWALALVALAEWPQGQAASVPADVASHWPPPFSLIASLPHAGWPTAATHSEQMFAIALPRPSLPSIGGALGAVGKLASAGAPPKPDVGRLAAAAPSFDPPSFGSGGGGGGDFNPPSFGGNGGNSNSNGANGGLPLQLPAGMSSAELAAAAQAMSSLMLSNPRIIQTQMQAVMPIAQQAMVDTAHDATPFATGASGATGFSGGPGPGGFSALPFAVGGAGGAGGPPPGAGGPPPGAGGPPGGGGGAPGGAPGGPGGPPGASSSTSPDVTASDLAAPGPEPTSCGAPDFECQMLKACYKCYSDITLPYCMNCLLLKQCAKMDLGCQMQKSCKVCEKLKGQGVYHPKLCGVIKC